MSETQSLYQGIGRFKVSSSLFSLALSIVLVAVYNQPLWHLLLQLQEAGGSSGIWFLVSFFIFLVAVFNILLSATGFRYIQKPLAIVVLLSAAAAAYFMNSYGIMFDRSMIQNAFETDTAEVQGLLNSSLLLYVVGLGVLPALFVARLKIVRGTPLHELKGRVLSILLSAVVILLIAVLFYKDYASTFRNHREIRHLIVPTSYLYYGARYLAGNPTAQPHEVQAIGEDAHLSPLWQTQDKKVVTLLVVGETARAENFALNGYSRNTDPELSQQKVINFTQVSSCGTNTAVSVPCMFSDLNRDEFDSEKGRSRQNVLDVLARAGIKVLWRDNNSGCKGVCDRIENQPLSTFRVDDYCHEAECFDEVLLSRLDEFLEQAQDNAVIVLHQKGSHGPAYGERYPAAYERFKPVCHSTDLQSCSQQSIINSYDNSIVYTDHFLSRVVEFLQQRSERFTTAMMYMSDHGESLGENNLYLHGLPYFLAPDTQTHVPFIVWLSPEYQTRFHVDGACLAAKQNQPLSHDYLFHSMLGLMAVETGVYNAALDIFSGCRQPLGEGQS